MHNAAFAAACLTSLVLCVWLFRLGVTIKRLREVIAEYRRREHEMLREITRLRAAAETSEPCQNANGRHATAVWPTQH